jgi:hypothetical protein
VLAEAVPARDFRVGTKSLQALKKQLRAPKILHDSEDDEQCEWVIRIKWLVSKDRDAALWKPGLFSTPQVRSSLAKQMKTLRYIESEWGVKFDEILEAPVN